MLLLFAGCALMTPTTGQKALVGNWRNDLGTVWMVHPDGTFDVDLNKDGKRDAWGHYTVSGNTISIFEAGGMVPKNCHGKAVYHFTRSGDSLSFQLVSDKCKLRIKNVLMAWHKA